jgi:hypothetical protein
MSDDEFDFYAQQRSGAISFAKPEQRTETFVMNEPHTDPNIAGWRALKDAITAAGGRVIEGPPQMLSGNGDVKRSSLYTRDTGVFLHVGGKEFFLYSDPNGASTRDVLRGEIGEMRKILGQPEFNGVTKIPLIADLEGGNLVYSPKHRTLFVGQTKHDFGMHLAEEYTPLMQHTIEELRTMPEHRDHLPMLELLHKLNVGAPLNEQEAQWMQDAEAYYDKPQQASLAALKTAVDAINQQLLKDGVITRLDEGVKVQPVSIPKEQSFPSRGLPETLAGNNFYHLDNVLNVLPGGQLVVCPSAIEKSSLKRVQDTVKGSPTYSISEDDAGRGAANFITVGHTVISPYVAEKSMDPNKPTMRQWLNEQGYEKVVTARDIAGLRDDSWRFASGAFVRCATQKLTPDCAFTEHAQGATPAVSANRG